MVEDDEGHLPDGTDVRAAIGVLQRIGVTTVLISAHDPESADAGARNRGAVCAAVARRCMHADWLSQNHTVQHRGHSPTLRKHLSSCAAIRWRAKRCRADHDDFICARMASTRFYRSDHRHFWMRSSAVRIWMRISSKPRMIRVRQLLLETEEDVAHTGGIPLYDLASTVPVRGICRPAGAGSAGISWTCTV